MDPPELQSRPAGVTPTEAYLRNVDATAKLDESLFVLLVIPEYRKILRQVILNTYFLNIRYEIERIIEKHRTLRREHIEEHIEAYREELMQSAEHPFSTHREIESIKIETPVRSAGFRRAIMKIYKYICAVCELNIQTASGACITDAAHIVPFSVSYNDDIRNGISLCRSHHWAFDAGLIAVSEDYRVVVSPTMAEQGPTALLLAELRNREIWLPGEPEHRPAPEALSWHREQVMRQWRHSHE